MSIDLRALVVDDEPIARQILADYIGRTPGLSLAGTCGNALEAFGMLSHVQADLLFLDINLPEISGLQFLRALSNPPAVIFTTAFAEHAVESYDLNAVDYLLKPFSYNRFCRAMEKVQSLLQPADELQPPAADALPSSLFLKSDGKLIRLEHSAVLYVEALKDYVRFQTADSNVVVHATMKATEDRLTGLAAFVRVHKSYIVNLQHVRSVAGNMLQIGAKEIPIGQTYRESVERAVANLQKR